MIDATGLRQMCTRKRAFVHERDAQRLADRFGNRVYRCPSCGFFHTTSKRTKAARAQRKIAYEARNILETWLAHVEKACRECAAKTLLRSKVASSRYPKGRPQPFAICRECLVKIGAWPV